MARQAARSLRPRPVHRASPRRNTTKGRLLHPQHRLDVSLVGGAVLGGDGGAGKYQNGQRVRRTAGQLPEAVEPVLVDEDAVPRLQRDMGLPHLAVQHALPGRRPTPGRGCQCTGPAQPGRGGQLVAVKRATGSSPGSWGICSCRWRSSRMGMGDSSAFGLGVVSYKRSDTTIPAVRQLSCKHGGGSASRAPPPFVFLSCRLRAQKAYSAIL